MTIQFLATSEDIGTLFQEKYVFWFAIFLIDELSIFVNHFSQRVDDESKDLLFHINQIHAKGAVTEERLLKLEMILEKDILNSLILNAQNQALTK